MMPPVDSDWLIAVSEKRTWDSPEIRAESNSDGSVNKN